MGLDVRWPKGKGGTKREESGGNMLKRAARTRSHSHKSINQQQLQHDIQ